MTNVDKIEPNRASGAGVAPYHDPIDDLPHELLPLMHPDRRRPRYHLLTAWRHFHRLRRDKESTREIFYIYDALPWRTVDKRVKLFLAKPRGQAIYTNEPYLPDILDDHEALRRFPPGTLAHDYCDYMECEGLTAAGIVDEFEVWRGDRRRLNDRVEWYNDRLRDTHDLLHLLTGFGRDVLGEQCVLSFVFHQRPSWGHLAVGHVSALLIKLKVKTRAPVWRAVREATRLGGHSERVAEWPIRELLAMTLAEARARLNIRHPRLYHEALRIWREEGIDHYAVLAKPAVE